MGENSTLYSPIPAAATGTCGTGRQYADRLCACMMSAVYILQPCRWRVQHFLLQPQQVFRPPLLLCIHLIVILLMLQLMHTKQKKKIQFFLGLETCIIIGQAGKRGFMKLQTLQSWESQVNIDSGGRYWCLPSSGVTKTHVFCGLDCLRTSRFFSCS